MIRMTRVRLINWHNFTDNTIDFKTITYLIGVNAVGKTTIMDAIRYCITTNKEFNTAGNRKSGRTLQGSVHQKQRADNEYLRPGHTVSYIGIEFLDESIRKRFTITARVESESPAQELRHVSQDWYISKPGYSLDDLPFFIEDRQGRRPSGRNEFQLANRGLDRAASQADARRKICRQLGIGDSESNTGKKFNKVFHMGTSLEDINDIRNFIYTYILPEPEVNIEGLYQDMRELENLQEVLEESKRRAELLAEINEHLNVSLSYEARVKVFEVLLCYARWQADLQKLKLLTEDRERTDLDIRVADAQIAELEEKCEIAENRLLDARAKLGDDENHQKMESLLSELKDDKKNYTYLIENAVSFDKAIENLQRLISMLEAQGIITPGAFSIPGQSDRDYAEKLTALQMRLAERSETLGENRGRLDYTFRQLAQDIQQLNTEIRQLESGQMVYPAECKLVLDAINRTFTERGIHEEAKLLCELLYMSRPEWQDAVESYLNTQRLYVIVPPEQYRLAKEAFISLGDSVKGIGLIDTISLMKDLPAVAKADVLTLADTVETGNPYARAYIDFRLGNVVCCESSGELEQYSKSVTADRLRYQGYVLQRMRRQTHYIGQDAITKRLEEAKLALRQKQIDQTETENSRKKMAALDDFYRGFMAGSGFSDLARFYHARDDAEVLFSEINALDTRIEELKRNPILQGMIDREAECKAAYDRENGSLTDKKAEKRTAEKQLETILQQLAYLGGEIERSEAAYQKYQDTHSRFIPDMESEYAELTRRQTPAELLTLNQSQGYMQRRINERDNYIRDNLIPLQRQFNAEYSLDYLPGLEGLEQYRAAYMSLTRIDLERHRENLRLAQIRCKERFRKEVLFRMKDDIDKARRLFRELNRVMGSLKYGEENYEFFISGSKDKELRVFYDLIMDKDNRQIRDEPDLFSLMEGQVSDIFEGQVEEFMQRIMVEVEQRSQQNVSGTKMTGHDMSAYADYRTYLDYDILVKNLVTNQTAYLSQVSGDGSGGENQAPFYVAICASLLQIYQQSENCIQLVLLDEAFNNMTSDRIKPMMKMFRDMNLQLVLIATPEKCTSIYPYCDVTYSIIKQGSRNAIASFEEVSG